MNENLLPLAKAPISGISVHFEGQTIEVKGDLKKGIRVPSKERRNWTRPLRARFAAGFRTAGLCA
jgi:hypothetical protein